MTQQRYYRVLVVEEDSPSRQALTSILRALGHPVMATDNLVGAMALLNTFQPERVILDLALPDGDGTELLEHVRREKLPVMVAVTTGASEEHAERARRSSPDGFFQKPLDRVAFFLWLREPRTPTP